MIANSHYEIDSSSLKDFWLHDALQRMSMKQLDFFFRSAYKIVFGKNERNEEKYLGWKGVYIDIVKEHVFGIVFYTNRIDKKFRFAFSSEYPGKTILGTTALWVMNSIFQNLLFLSVGFGKSEKERKDRYVSSYVSFYSDCGGEKTGLFAYNMLKDEDEDLCQMRNNLWQKQKLS